MEFTVCVCVRDGADHVDRCLAALLAATADVAAPIVVVDHASRDSTPELLERWAGAANGRLRRMRFDGDGLAAVRDFAWRQSETPWVGFVDIDCEVQPGWGDAVVAALRAHAGDLRCAGVGGSNRPPRDGGWLSRACAVFLATYFGGHDSILNRPVAERRRVEHCPTLNVVYRRSALKDIGGFDPAYTRLGEDLDVSRRLLRAGYELWSEPGMVVEHALRPTLREWLRNMYRYGRGRTFYLKRHPGDFHAKFLAPAGVVLAYAAIVLSVALGRVAPLWLPAMAAAHITAIAVALAGEARRQGAGIAAWLAATAVVFLTHLAYGVGLLSELPRRRDRFAL